MIRRALHNLRLLSQELDTRFAELLVDIAERSMKS
jgi:hypothetical protein